MNRRLQQSLLVADLLWIAISMGLATILARRLSPDPGTLLHHLYAPSLVVAALIWTVLYFSKDLQSFCRGWYLPSVFAQAFVGDAYLIGSLLIFALLTQHSYSRTEILYLSCLLPAGFIATRCIACWLVTSRSHMRPKRKVVIVGSGRIVRELLVKIERHPELSMEVAGVLFPSEAEPCGKALGFGLDMVPVRTLNILDLLKENNVQELILAESVPGRPEIEQLISSCRKAGLRIQIVPHHFELYLSKARLTEIEDVPLLSLEEQNLPFVGFQLKRVMDFLGAACLLVLVSPLVMFSAAVLHWKKGRAFKQEKRCGKNEVSFKMYRLNVDRDEANLVGHERFLVQFSLTELPQLFNVLKGEMSLVGPRPEPLERIKHYSIWQRQRLNVKPGLTGLAQVHGLREQHSSEEKVHFDLHYIFHWSLFLDLCLVVQTAWTLFLRHVQEHRFSISPLIRTTQRSDLAIGRIWNVNSTQSGAD